MDLHHFFIDMCTHTLKQTLTASRNKKIQEFTELVDFAGPPRGVSHHKMGFYWARPFLACDILTVRNFTVFKGDEFRV